MQISKSACSVTELLFVAKCTIFILKGTSKNCIFEFDQQTVNDNPYSKLL